MLEPLDQRRLLAAHWVDSPSDVIDPTDGVTSLREAVEAANNSAGHDQILFDAAVFASAQTIELKLGALEITDAVSIDGPEAMVTLRSDGTDRVLDLLASAGDVVLSRLVVTGGGTAGAGESGAGIRFLSSGTLSLQSVTVIENRTTGEAAGGGGIYAVGGIALADSVVVANSTGGEGAAGGGVFVESGPLVASRSEFSGNETTGSRSHGGALHIASGSIALSEVVVANNQTRGNESDGGGISSAQAAQLTASLLTDNQTLGEDADGGALFARGALSLTETIVRGNRTVGDFSGGGGIASSEGDVSIVSSSIVTNETSGEFAFGGGMVAARGVVAIENSTFSANRTTGSGADGGGLATFFSSVTIDGSTFAFNQSAGTGGGISFSDDGSEELTIRNAIVAANEDFGDAPDMQSPVSSAKLTVRGTLIGDNAGTGLAEAGVNDIDRNQVGDQNGAGAIDPRLAPLRFNGRSWTHAPLADSPAVDSADPALVTTENDARGAPFLRVANFTPDRGSHELQTVGSFRFVVTTEADQRSFEDGAVSLREAIETANGNPGHDTIRFQGPPFDQQATIELLLGELVITDSLTIEGIGASSLVIDAQRKSRVMRIDPNAGHVTLGDLTLASGATTAPADERLVRDGNGGGLLFESNADLVLDDVIVMANRTLGSGAAGGGMFAAGGQVIVRDGEWLNNETVGHYAGGGGIASFGASIEINQSRMEGNRSSGDASPGGAIRIGSASLVLRDSSFTGNATEGTRSGGGAVASFASNVALQRVTANMNATSGDGSGGGAFQTAASTLDIRFSSIVDNQTEGADSHGGGIEAESLSLRNSTVARNQTLGEAADGGGIHASTADVRDSTISGNRTVAADSAGGGLWTESAQVLFSTVTENRSGRGGGISWPSVPGAMLSIDSTIVAGNLATVAPDLDRSAGHAGAFDLRSSLIGDGSGSGVSESQSPQDDGNLVGAASPGGGVIDPRLQPLDHRGGPTEIHALHDDSPALDRGRLGGADREFDQRGTPFVRVFGGAPDIGAFESQRLDPTLLVVTTAVDELDATNGRVSLREAIRFANGSEGVDVITFDATQFTAASTILLSLGELAITEAVSIQGPGSDRLTIDAQTRSRVIDFRDEGGSLDLSGLTIANGETDGVGGGVRFASSDGTLSLNRVDFVSNRSALTGGGVHADGSIVATNSRWSDNVASSAGGGIWADDIAISSSLIAGNVTDQVDGSGGGIHAQSVDLTDTHLIGNRVRGAASDGGGVYAKRLTLVGGSVRGNATEQGHGGGIAVQGTVTIRDATVSGNSAWGLGGGIHVALHEAAALSVDHASVSQNSVVGPGGKGAGIWVDGDTVITDSTISDNAALGAGSDGGGIFVSSGRLELQRSTVTFNSATRIGGGILVPFATDKPLVVGSTILAGNTDLGIAPNFRAVLQPDHLQVSSSLIDDNTGTSLAESQTPDFRGNLVGRPSPAGAGLIDPQLGPLTTIGGAQVRPLVAGSPAIDRGDSGLTLPDHDQRGAPFARNFGSSVDIGAFEFQGPEEAVIRWTVPAPVAVGTPLGLSQLNATAAVAGTFVYSPELGTVLNTTGRQALTVTFTPAEMTYFLPATASVEIDVVTPQDFGDAPSSFGTGLADDGPRHDESGLRLGDDIDFELDAAAGNRADGDGTDDDGVRLVTSMVASPEGATQATFLVTASAASKLDAWIDFDGDGRFDHASEHVGGGSSIDLRRGDNLVTISVPPHAVAGITYGRFRLSSAGGLMPGGQAADGEVEDYELVVFNGAVAPAIEIALPRGATTLTATATELVVQQGGTERFRAPRSAIGRYDIAGTEFSDVLVINYGAGDPIPAVGGLRFDGRDRVNTVRLVAADTTFDLTSDSLVSLRNIAAIDLTDTAATTVVVDQVSAFAMDEVGNGVILTGGRDDQLTIADGELWRMNDPVTVAGFVFNQVATLGTFLQTDFGSPWQNLAQASDVGNDGSVTANDALRIINELGRRLFSDESTSQLMDPRDVAVWPNVYYDQNGDGKATALDALRVINELARIRDASDAGEGEPLPATDATAQGVDAVSGQWKHVAPRDDGPGREPQFRELLRPDFRHAEPMTRGSFGPPFWTIPAERAFRDRLTESSVSAVDESIADSEFLEELRGRLHRYV